MRLEVDGNELWVKDDGASHPVYGGNKVRKARDIVDDARRRGARRLVTVGAAGSHHVLTLALFGLDAGLDVTAVLFPQPRTEHVAATLRATLGTGARVLAVPHPALVPARVALALGPGDVFVPPGGSNLLGALAYARAVDELGRQLDALAMAPPALIVVGVGSGGTAAGIAAGVLRRRWPTRVLGVQVVPGRVVSLMTSRLTRAVLRHLGVSSVSPRRTLVFDRSQVGAGYGHPTAAGADAIEVGARLGLGLDETYTAKVFAAVLTKIGALPSASAPSVLYWHTLSSAPLAPLLEPAPREADLPPRLRRLLA